MILDLDPVAPEHWIAQEAVRVLARGGVVALPTDTVYAVACDVDSEEAAGRIYRLKGMDPKKLLSI
ncbi:MAG: Sua5/YciO/YrdC/YwlC family protein, partial [Deltaproteobacteria bacterium]|nr:Sua5/YciO/YrdC/YwlC family protein [Deltaproteobacteria bacterium]